MVKAILFTTAKKIQKLLKYTFPLTMWEFLKKRSRGLNFVASTPNVSELVLSLSKYWNQLLGVLQTWRTLLGNSFQPALVPNYLQGLELLRLVSTNDLASFNS